MEQISDTQLAYIAGLVDGEGTVTLRKRPRPGSRNGIEFIATIQIANTDRKVIDYIKTTLKLGWIATDKRAAPSNNWKDAYHWMTNSYVVAVLLRQLLPYLIVKKKQALLVIEAAEIVHGLGRGRHTSGPYPTRLFEIYTELRAMNKRGRK